MRSEHGLALPYLAWRLDSPLMTASTASAGGGLGLRSWVVNAQVGHDYARHDLSVHADELASAAMLSGPGVTMLTAAEVTRCHTATDGGVRAWATVGLTDPTWAAAPQEPAPAEPGTINIVAWLPAALTEAALLNALCTVTEAKSQALAARGVAGTGTPSDAVTVLCPPSGSVEPFCGPRSRWGSRLARAVHAAVWDGVDAPSAEQQ